MGRGVGAEDAKEVGGEKRRARESKDCTHSRARLERTSKIQKSAVWKVEDNITARHCSPESVNKVKFIIAHRKCQAIRNA